MANLTKAQRHNRMLEDVYQQYHEQEFAMAIRKLMSEDKLEEFSRFVNANQDLKIKEVFSMYDRITNNIPF